MIVEFGEEYLRDLYVKGEYSDKKHRYRIEFTVRDTVEEPILTICNIVELSNHYD